MKTREVVLAALMIALLTVAGQFSIPLPFSPAPITLQTLIVMLAGGLLGARLGGISMAAFVLLAALGLPILNKFSGGLGVILGPTGGFVLSWPLAAFVIGYLVERSWNRLTVWNVLLYNVLGGVVLVYLIGCPWLALAIGKPISAGFVISAAFVPGDLLKALVAAVLAVRIRRAYPLIRPTGHEHSRHGA